jgi:hypothetical protein
VNISFDGPFYNTICETCAVEKPPKRAKIRHG